MLSNGVLLAVVLAFASVSLAQGQTLSSAQCTAFIDSDTLPASLGFTAAVTGPLVDSNIFYLGRCNLPGDNCSTLSDLNPSEWTPVTQYEIGVEYALILDPVSLLPFGNLYQNYLLKYSPATNVNELVEALLRYEDVSFIRDDEDECIFHSDSAANSTFWIYKPSASAAASMSFDVYATFESLTSSDFIRRYTLDVTLRPQDCPFSNLPEGVDECEARYEDDTCQATCINGYVPAADNTLTCTSGGTFAGAPVCEKIPDYCPTQVSLPEGGFDTDITITCTGTDAEVGDICLASTGYCLGATASDDDLECVGLTSSFGQWVIQGTSTRPECSYAGPCPYPNDNVNNKLDDQVIFVNEAGACGNLEVGEDCTYHCALGYATASPATLTCTAGGWSPDGTCDLITDFCDIADITGDGVTAGECTTRDITEDLRCNYGCSDPTEIPESASIVCDGATSIGWSKDDFNCLPGFPTPAPVPTPQPTFQPPPTSPTPPTPPTVPSTPTLNPFLSTDQPAQPVSDEGIFIIVGAGGGAAALALFVCLFFALRRPPSVGYEIPVAEEKLMAGAANPSFQGNQAGESITPGAQAGPNPGSNFLTIQKKQYNAFDQW